jgi:hypothetical protein
MILIKNRYIKLIVSFIFVFCFFSYTLPGQKNNSSGQSTLKEGNGFKQDTAVMRKEKNIIAAEPDTNFTFEKYAAFLTKISDTSKYIVLPINEFRQTFNSKKIIIGLRHDVDNDLNVAYNFSETESKLGVRSTYYILHTAPYYLANTNNKEVHTENILPTLKSMQNDRHFEIGWHNDLVTLQAVYNIDPVSFLHNELAWLRLNGINIYGSASHGSNYCYVFKYLNYYFFEECSTPVVGQFVNNINLPIDGKTVPMKKGKFSDFDLKYEAYFLDNNKYFSDATITNSIRWNIGMLDLNQLRGGDRVIILLHPIHWHKASVFANIETFKFNGQKSASMDAVNSIITVNMPYGTNRSSLIADFTLSPGAISKISGKLQVTGVTSNNFSSPVTYSLSAENRDIRKDWIIKVQNEKNQACNFESFSIPGFTKTVKINPVLKTIVLEVLDGINLSHLPVQFELSAGARVWKDNNEQFSNIGTVNFIKSVEYKIVAEDGVTLGLWTVSILPGIVGIEDQKSDHSGLLIYPNPSDGLINMQFNNIQTSPLLINVYNSQGKSVYLDKTNKRGTFLIKADLKNLSSGLYFVKYLESEKPVAIVIHDH